MTVQAQAVTPSTNPPNPRATFTNKDGTLATGGGSGLSTVTQIRQIVNGLTPTISCNATFALNVYTLTPLNISPNVANYYSFWSFAFTAPASSTGLITATVVPNTGTLPTLPVYKSHGAAQATSGDLVVNMFYIMHYVDTLNSNNGGFVLVGV